TTGHTAKKEVGRNFVIPGRWFNNGPSIVGVTELDVIDHRHFTASVPATASSTGTGCAVPSLLFTAWFSRWPVSVEFRQRHFLRAPINAVAAAANIPAAAIPTFLYISGRSLVGTCGSGGRP